MRRLFLLLCLLPVLALAEPADKPISETGLPIPRFVSLRKDEVNLRAGPGTRYPINWTYHRAGLPVEIINEFGNWRQVRDFDGVDGWALHSMLSGKRTAMIWKKTQFLYREPESDSAKLLKAEPGVVADIKECQADWCQLLLEGRKGWVPKSGLWGIYRQEKFEQ